MEVKEADAVYATQPAVSMGFVLPGYRQTEVGVIPEDWQTVTLSEKAEIRSGGTPSTSTPKFWGGDIPWCTPTDITELGGEKYLLSTNNKISKFGLQSSSAELIPPYSVIMTSRATIGECAINLMPVATNQGFKNLVPHADVDVEFLYYVMCVKKAQLSRLSAGSTFLEIGKAQLSSLQIQFPSTKAEQEAIAEVLSDADALIESLQQLIAKKRQIKQGTMQALLTGKQRLPNFNGEWSVKRLGEVFSISAGKSKSAYIDTVGAYWIVDMGSVSTDGRLIVSKVTNYLGDFLNAGDLVMPKDDIGGGGIIGKVGFIDADKTYVLGDHVYLLTAKYGDPLFLTYLINAHKTNSELRKKVIGSAQLGLGRKSVEDQEIPFPSIDEQTAIATVLGDMDAEIVALETRLAKNRQLKQGVMQQLLTGRIRLI